MKEQYFFFVISERNYWTENLKNLLFFFSLRNYIDDVAN